MTTAKQAGRIAGLAISLGIGLAVASGAVGEAQAEPADSPSSDGAESASSQTANRAGDTDDTLSPEDSESERESPARLQAAAAQDSDGTGPSQADIAPDDTVEKQLDLAAELADSPQIKNSPSSSVDDSSTQRRQQPVETQALTAVLGSARRQSDQPAAAVADPAVTSPASAAAETAESPEPGELSRGESASAATVTASNPVPTAMSTVPTNAVPTARATVASVDGITGVNQVVVTADDADDDVLTYTAGSAIFGAVANLGDGNFTYRPNEFVRFLARFLPFLNSDRFYVTVSDGRGGTTSARVNTTIIPVNAAPVVRARNVGAPNAETGVVVGSVQASDPNWDSLTYVEATIVTDKGTANVNRGGGFSYTPHSVARHGAAADSATTAEKTDTFTVQAVDKYGAVADIPVTVVISPSNSAPTALATVGIPDAITGVATGIVVGTDADSDALRFGGSTTTLKGTLVVEADGSFTYTPDAYARYNAWHPYATFSDGIDTVRITVDDGHGGLATVPVTVAISPSSEEPPAKPLSTFCGCVLMPADTIFRADVRSLPLLPESDEFIELLGGSAGETLKAGMGAKEWMGSTGGGLPVNVVDESHPKETVVFNRGYSTSGPGIDDRPYAIPDYPIVEGMPSVPAWDRHLLVFQKGTCISQELINVANGVELPAAGVLDALGNAAYRLIWGDTWIAQGGAQYDMSSHLYPEIGFATASQLPLVPMMLRPDELERGEIDHMLGMVIAKDRGAGFSWPARAGDGSSPEGIPMGTVFRLRADVDITQYSQSTQVVLRALQVHGAVVYDSKGPGTEGASLLTMGTDWDDPDHIVAAAELSTVPMEFFEAVDVSSIAVDPATGWQIG